MLISAVNTSVMLVMDEVSIIPSAGGSVPQTGDESQPLVWGALALGSLLAATLILRRRRCY